MYKVKNITDNDLVFEGITIPAGKVSDELTLATHQRLLAIYEGKSLVNVEATPLVRDIPAPVPEQPEPVLVPVEATIVPTATTEELPVTEEKPKKGRKPKVHNPIE